MELDLNNPDDFTKDGVRRLIASKTGNEEGRNLYQVRVTKNGIAYLVQKTSNTLPEDWESHAIMFENWNSSYVGKDAARDEGWVSKVYNMLSRWWDEYSEQDPKGQRGAFYADYKL